MRIPFVVTLGTTTSCFGAATPEIDVLVDLFRTQVGRPLRSLIEFGCGPGYQTRALALRGYAASGLDRSEEMIRFARPEAEREGAAVEWIVGDMLRDFRLPTPVDLACCLLDSIDGLDSIQDFVRHFQVVAGRLVSDGIYVIGQSHRRDTSLIAYGPFHYEGQRDGSSRARLGHRRADAHPVANGRH